MQRPGCPGSGEENMADLVRVARVLGYLRGAPESLVNLRVLQSSSSWRAQSFREFTRQFAVSM